MFFELLEQRVLLSAYPVLLDINPGTNDAIWANQPTSSGYYFKPQNGVMFNGKTYFGADDGVHGRELWVSDGTAAGTHMVTDLVPGPQGSSPVGLLVHAGALYFVNTSNFHLYKTDGSGPGTVQITSTSDGNFIVRGYGNPNVLLEYQGEVAFLGYQSTTHTSLWLSDGTPQGTHRAGDTISTSTDDPAQLTVSGNLLYFTMHFVGHNSLCAFDGTSWREVLKTGTERLTDFNGKLLFDAGDPTITAVFITDGTNVTQLTGPETISSIAVLGGIAVVSATTFSPTFHYALWRTDGTPSGTSEYFAYNNPLMDLHVAAGKAWGFTSINDSLGMEPWVTDGTAGGTFSLGDLNPGSASSYVSGYPGPQHEPYFVEGPDGRVYFQATTAAQGTELFSSDGTAAGTHLTADFVPGPGDSLPGPFMLAGGNLFVAANDPLYGREWHQLTFITSTVEARLAFYNHSYWNDPANGFTNDDNAIDTSKSALLPGQTASFANYTGCSMGINGIMVDIANLPAGNPTTSDFSFKVGNDNNPGAWAAAPVLPAIFVRRGEGTAGSARIELIWSDNAIQDEWLQVTVAADAATGLASPDVFYFGNSIGETGDSTTDTYVNAGDFIGVRDHPADFTNRALPSNPYDFNHDSFVDGTDLIITRDNANDFTTALKLISPPSGAAAPAAMALSASPSNLSSRSVVAPTPQAQPAIALPMIASRGTETKLRRRKLLNADLLK